MINEGFIEVSRGYWYKELDGTPWSSIKQIGKGYGKGFYKTYDNTLKPLNADHRRYIIIRINGKNKKWHRLVWEYFRGEIPKGIQVDHIDNNPLNNLISNLQLLSNKDNIRYAKKRKDNSSGYPGVQNKGKYGYESKIMVDSKNVWLGYFDTPEEAYKVYYLAKIQYHGAESVRALSLPISPTIGNINSDI